MRVAAANDGFVDRYPGEACIGGSFGPAAERDWHRQYSDVASVKLWHTLLDLDTSLFNSIEFKLTKKGLLRSMQHIIRQAAPMTPQILRRIRQKLKLHNPADATYWALFLIAFFTMARKSNLVPDTVASFNPEKQLSRQKILVGDGCLLVFWTWAKNIQNRDRAHKIPLLQIPGSPLCPVAAYKNMCNLIPLKEHQAAFSVISSTGPVPVTYPQFNGKLKQLIQACGLNPDDYSTHGFRRGGASCAFRAKVPDSLIQLQGDWASDCYKRYLEMGLVDKRDVSLKLIKHIKKQSV